MEIPSATAAEARVSKSDGAAWNTQCGWPAAAHTAGNLNSEASIKTGNSAGNPIGETPPMAYPVAAFTRSASGRLHLPVPPTQAASAFTSHCRSPATSAMTGVSGSPAVKTSVLTIAPVSTPSAAAAYSALRAVSSSAITG